MKEYLDKKIDVLLSKEDDLEDTLKFLLGYSYISLRTICMNKDIFIDECIALAYDKMKGERDEK